MMTQLPDDDEDDIVEEKDGAQDHPPEDVLQAASKLSQVKGQQKSGLLGHPMALGVIAAVVLMGLMIIFTGHSKSKSSENQNVVAAQTQSDDELQSNLEKLKALNLSNNTPSAPRWDEVDAGEESSKEYLARQNAPINLYTDASNGAATQENSSNSTASGDAPSVFAGHNTYAQFGNQSMAASVVSASQILHPEYTIASGEFIHATLETAISSDLPGEVRAITEQPVYGYVGQAPIIPAGSRLIGQYASSVLQGQNRVFVIWNRIILPNGISVMLNSPGMDEIGRAGQTADDVDTHFFARFGQAILLSLIGAGAANVGVSGSNTQQNSAADYRSAMAQSFSQSAQDSLQNSAQVQPTLTIFQGAKITVFVAHDLDFYSALHPSENMAGAGA